MAWVTKPLPLPRGFEGSERATPFAHDPSRDRFALEKPKQLASLSVARFTAEDRGVRCNSDGAATESSTCSLRRSL
jgi:hypothetical protein